MVETRTIEQTVVFSATPHEVYEALMDSEKHARFTEAPATISREVGGAFTAYDGIIHGTNLEVVPDRLIVQLWHIDNPDCGWPANHYSRLTILLEDVQGQTRLIMVHSNVPAGCYDNISEGWKAQYWVRIKKIVEG